MNTDGWMLIQTLLEDKSTLWRQSADVLFFTLFVSKYKPYYLSVDNNKYYLCNTICRKLCRRFQNFIYFTYRLNIIEHYVYKKYINIAKSWKVLILYKYPVYYYCYDEVIRIFSLAYSNYHQTK